MPINLPSLQSSQTLIEDGKPNYVFQHWWQEVTTAITNSINDLTALIIRLTATETDISALENRNLTAGAGLTGGGNLTADRTFNVGAGTGITVSADAVSLENTAVTPNTYGSATTVPSITVDAQGRITNAVDNVIPVLASGTYTPSLTNVSNLDSSSASVAQYMRVGNVVTVSGSVTVDPTATGSVQLGMSLPVSSSFSAAEQLGGVSASANVSGQSASIQADPTNDRAQLDFVTTDTSSRVMSYTYSYQIL